MRRKPAIALAMVLAASVSGHSAETPSVKPIMLFSFESDKEVEGLAREAGAMGLGKEFPLAAVAENATDGTKALKAEFPAKGDWWGIHFQNTQSNWSAHAELKLDVFNPADQTVELRFAAADEGGEYIQGPRSVGRETDVCETLVAKPGRNTLAVSLAGLRTEMGDRLLDLSRIKRFVLFVGNRPHGSPQTLFLDNIRIEGSVKDQDSNAALPCELEIKPTMQCLGILWRIKGDRNANATAAVEYRKTGAIEWKIAMPLFRRAPQDVNVASNTVGGITVPFLGGLPRWDWGTKRYLIKSLTRNYLGGSVFYLEPGTSYDVRVALSDPDGGSCTRVTTVTTRAVPALPIEGNTIHVRGGGGALKKAVADAKPGDIFLVHAGEYVGPVLVEASGTTERPITIRSAGDGEAVVRGAFRKKDPKRWTEDDDQEGATDVFTVRGAHIRIHDLSITGGFIGVYCGTRRTPMGAHDLSLTRCRITDVFHGIYGKGNDCHVADNRIRGDWHGGNEGEGVEIRGRGNVVCYNTITHVADGTSIYVNTSDCDFHNNLVMHCGDDHLELDYSGPNNRVFENVFSFNTINSISVQPYVAGPGYLVRNAILNGDEATIKDRYKASGLVMINNTFFAMSGPTPIPENTYSRNNLFISRPGPALLYHMEDFMRQPATLDTDYDGFSGPIVGGGVGVWLTGDQGAAWRTRSFHTKMKSVAEFRAGVGLEQHGVAIEEGSCFQGPFPPKDEDPDWKGLQCPDFSLKESSSAIDKGIGIPNMVEKYQGKAPDLGALEFGAPPLQWGIRPDTANAGPTR